MAFSAIKSIALFGNKNSKNAASIKASKQSKNAFSASSAPAQPKATKCTSDKIKATVSKLSCGSLKFKTKAEKAAKKAAKEAEAKLAQNLADRNMYLVPYSERLLGPSIYDAPIEAEEEFCPFPDVETMDDLLRHVQFYAAARKPEYADAECIQSQAGDISYVHSEAGEISCTYSASIYSEIPTADQVDEDTSILAETLGAPASGTATPTPQTVATPFVADSADSWSIERPSEMFADMLSSKLETVEEECEAPAAAEPETTPAPKISSMCSKLFGATTPDVVNTNVAEETEAFSYSLFPERRTWHVEAEARRQALTLGGQEKPTYQVFNYDSFDGKVTDVIFTWGNTSQNRQVVNQA
ncbi:hypothetical protein PYCC9005_001575 [Savitreella phatthalungensis]